MVRYLIELSLRFRLLIIALALCLITISFIQCYYISVDSLPEFAPPFIQVQTEAPGLSTSEVEELITFNLEELLNGTPWIESIRSISVPGLSNVIITFKPNTDVMRARQLVNERLGLAYALPNVAQVPVILQPMSATSRVMMIGLSSSDISPIQMSVLAYWNLRPALLSVPGVANVAIWGLRDKQMQVLADPTILKAKQTTLDQIISTTGNALWVSPLSFLNASTPGSGGWIDTPQQRMEVRHVLPIANPSQLSKVDVEEHNGSILGDVTKIVEGHPPLIGDASVSNIAGLLMVVDKFPNANSIEVARLVQEKISEMQPGLKGIEIGNLSFKPSTFVSMIIANMGMILLIGTLLTIGLLWVLLASWRTVLVALITIVTAIAMTLLFLSISGSTLNLMVLTGFAVALIVLVNNTILTLQNTQQLIAQDKTTKNYENIILPSSLKTSRNIIYTTLILALICVPIFFLNGLVREFLVPLTSTYLLTIVASVISILLVTPALESLLLIDIKPSPFINHLKSGYDRSFSIWQNIPSKLIFFVTLVVSILAIIGFSLLLNKHTIQPLPAFKEPNLVIKWNATPGTSLREMVRITSIAGKEIQKVPGVLNVVTHIGRAILGDQVVDVNSADMLVNIVADDDYSKTVTAIKKVVHGYPGFHQTIQTYLQDRINRASNDLSSDLAVRIYGTDFKLLQQKAEEIKQHIANVEGATDIYIQQSLQQPEISVEADLEKAQVHGLKPGDVRRAAATYIAGLQAGSLFQEQKIFPVVVWGAQDTRNSLDSIRNLLIDTPQKNWIKLGDVASVDIKPTLNMIQHEKVSRYIDINLNVKNRSHAAVVNDINERLRQVSFPLEFHTDVLGSYAESYQDQFKLTLIILSIALIVYLILQSIVESFLLAAIILIAIPAALSGGIVMAYFLNRVSLAALFGLIALLSLTISLIVTLLTRYNELKKSSSDKLPSIIAFSLNELFSSVIVTTLVILIFFIPFIFAYGLPGLEIIRPMVMIIFGGLITVLLTFLFIIPTLLIHFDAPTSRGKINATN